MHCYSCNRDLPDNEVTWPSKRCSACYVRMSNGAYDRPPVPAVFTAAFTDQELDLGVQLHRSQSPEPESDFDHWRW